MSGQTNGGVFNPKNLSLFTYTYNNPVNLVDPDGMAPNKMGVTTADTVYLELKDYEAKGMSHSQALNKLSMNHPSNSNRYFFTDEYGWIDIRHFGKAAEMGFENEGNVWTEVLGFGNETLQWLTEWGDDYRSGFSPEDIPSNAAGARFGENIDKKQKLSEQFKLWVEKNGGRSPADEQSGYQNLPSSDPAVKGGEQRGSSNLGSDGVENNRPTPQVDFGEGA